MNEVTEQFLLSIGFLPKDSNYVGGIWELRNDEGLHIEYRNNGVIKNCNRTDTRDMDPMDWSTQAFMGLLYSVIREDGCKSQREDEDERRALQAEYCD